MATKKKKRTTPPTQRFDVCSLTVPFIRRMMLNGFGKYTDRYKVSDWIAVHQAELRKIMFPHLMAYLQEHFEELKGLWEDWPEEFPQPMKPRDLDKELFALDQFGDMSPDIREDLKGAFERELAVHMHKLDEEFGVE